MRSVSPNTSARWRARSSERAESSTAVTVRARAGEVDRVCAEAAPDLQHALSGPALELCKPGNVRLDEVFSRFDFIEILARADRCWGVAEIARAVVPVFANPIDGRLAKRGALADASAHC